MKRMLRPLTLLALALASGLGVRAALSSTSVSGIPPTCQMAVHRVKVDAEGKPKGAPETLVDTRMLGNWAARAFRRSWDGKMTVAHTFEGFRLIKGDEKHDYKIPFLHRNFWWSPDSKKFIVWTPGGIAVLDASDLGPPGGNAKHKIVYSAPKGRFPMGVAWAPDGSHIFLSENYLEGGTTKSVLQKIPADGGAATTVLEHPEMRFYMPADSWYEDGSGPKVKSPVLFGAADGLWSMDSTGGDKAKLLESFSADGLTDIIWDPSQKEEVVFVFRKAAITADKKEWKGLYLLHADEAKKKKDSVEQISDSLSIHTLFFSPKGKRIGWASRDGAWYRDTASKDAPTKITVSGATGDVKGISWDDKEEKLAIAQGDQLFCYDLKTKTTTPLAKAPLPKSFVAEPFWRGDEIVYATYADVLEKKKLEDEKK